MKITILTVGKPKDKHITALISDYLGRIRPRGLVGTEHIPDSSARTPEEAIEREGQEILKALRPRDRVILLRDDGREFSSPDFAAFLSGEAERAAGRLLFVIGGPWGVSDAVKERADGGGLSLSRMTFTHEMCCLFLAEQLYRAFSIINGTKYHH